MIDAVIDGSAAGTSYGAGKITVKNLTYDELLKYLDSTKSIEFADKNLNILSPGISRYKC